MKDVMFNAFQDELDKLAAFERTKKVGKKFVLPLALLTGGAAGGRATAPKPPVKEPTKKTAPAEPGNKPSKEAKKKPKFERWASGKESLQDIISPKERQEFLMKKRRSRQLHEINETRVRRGEKLTPKDIREMLASTRHTAPHHKPDPKDLGELAHAVGKRPAKDFGQGRFPKGKHLEEKMKQRRATQQGLTDIVEHGKRELKQRTENPK